jgi:hypothetical protein
MIKLKINVRHPLVRGLALFAVIFGSASCKTAVKPKVPILAGGYYLIPLNYTVKIQRKPDWSIRVDAIDPQMKTCTVEVIAAGQATPNVATLHLDDGLPDIPGRGHTQTGAVVHIRSDVVKVWANTQ